MSETMRALVLYEPGGPEVLQVRDVTKPRIKRQSDVLVRVLAAGVNPADWQNRKSGQRHDPNAETGSPTILGMTSSRERLSGSTKGALREDRAPFVFSPAGKRHRPRLRAVACETYCDRDSAT